MELKKILCAVDLSDSSNPSVEYAKLFASMSGAGILVAYVLPAQTAYEDVYLSHSDRPNEINAPSRETAEALDAFIAKNFPDNKPERVVLVGRPSEQLAKVAEDRGIDMIIMGTHGRSGLDRLFFGSVANELVKIAPCPVMTVRPEEVETQK